MSDHDESVDSDPPQKREPVSVGALHARRNSAARLAMLAGRAKMRVARRKNALFLGTPGYVAPLTGLTGPLADLNETLPLSIKRIAGNNDEEDQFIVKVRRKNEKQVIELLLVEKNFELR